jgi:hypothetical protein
MSEDKAGILDIWQRICCRYRKRIKKELNYDTSQSSQQIGMRAIIDPRENAKKKKGKQ